jgi:hypothetical protein
MSKLPIKKKLSLAHERFSNSSKPCGAFPQTAKPAELEIDKVLFVASHKNLNISIT